MFFSCSHDGTIKQWDADSFELITTLQVCYLLTEIYPTAHIYEGQAASKLPSAEASKWAQCTSPGQYTPYIKGIVKTP